MGERALDRLRIARIGMSHDTAGGIIPPHALDATRCGSAAVTHDDDAGVLRISHPHAAAVVNRYPSRATGGVQQGVEQRPVRTASLPSSMASVSRFGLATEPESR